MCIFVIVFVFFRECVRFCYTQIIQHELDLVRQEWNDHQIRRQNRREVHGRPEILYHHPDLYGIMLNIIITSDRCELFVFTVKHVQLYGKTAFQYNVFKTPLLNYIMDRIYIAHNLTCGIRWWRNSCMIILVKIVFLHAHFSMCSPILSKYWTARGQKKY